MELRVLIADDHALLRAGVGGALAAVDGMKVVGEASSEAQLLPLIARTSPHVLLLDLQMAELNALPCLRRIRDAYPDLKVIAFSDKGDAREILAVLEEGACGYILKSIDPFDLPASIRQAVNGTFYTLGGLTFELSRAQIAPELSARETEVLQRVAAGLSNRAIAKDLWLSDQTVKFHLHKIYRKLGVSNRTEAARYAHQVGLSEAAG